MFLLLGLPIACSALSGVVFCLDFDPFVFLLLFACLVFFLYLFIYLSILTFRVSFHYVDVVIVMRHILS